MTLSHSHDQPFFPRTPALSISTSTTTSTLSLSDLANQSAGDLESSQSMSMNGGDGAMGARPSVVTHSSSGSVPSTNSSTSSPLYPPTPESHEISLDDSPSGSVASTAKDGLTPRAELSQPIWPLSFTKMDGRKSKPSDEPRGIPGAEGANLPGTGGLKRDGSLSKKQASLDTPPSILTSFSDLQAAPFLARPPETRHFGGQVPAEHGLFSSTQGRRHSEEPSLQAPSGSQIIASSTTTGCCISAPMSPPAHYPIPMSASSSSSGTNRTPSSPKSSTSSTFAKAPPRWAQPPTRANRISVRAKSFGDAMMERPDVDFDPELFESAEGDDEIEVIKGAEGRIAVKATKAVYEILVWLPGFTLDNITIATRGARTIHIVADQWDEGDHAQWDIKLGDDANMRSISAKFGGHDLKITVAREQRRKTSSSSRLGREKPSTSTPSTPSQAHTATVESAEPADYWASQWSPHPMTRRVQPVKKSSLKTI